MGGLSDIGGAEIPDPYGGNDADFDHVLDLLGAAAPVIAARLAQLLAPPGRRPREAPSGGRVRARVSRRPRPVDRPADRPGRP